MEDVDTDDVERLGAAFERLGAAFERLDAAFEREVGVTEPAVGLATTLRDQRALVDFALAWVERNR
jgi:aminoglycoside N3'-acetyltransferase